MKMAKVAVLGILVFVLLCGTSVGAEKKELRLGVLQWDDHIIINLMTKRVLEKFGYNVKLVDFFEWGIAFAALEKGDIDVLSSLVDFCAADYWKRSKEKLEKIGVPGYGMDMALAVPTYVPIDSIEQLNANKDKFENKIVGIEPGSGLMRQTKQVIEAYDLKLTLVEGSTAAMVSNFKSAIDRKKWVVATLWTPFWVMQVYDVKFLKDPKGIQQGPQSYHFLGRKGFSKEFPFARELLSGIYVPLNDMNYIASLIKDGKKLPEAVDIWFQNKRNKAQFDAWCAIGSPDRY